MAWARMLLTHHSCQAYCSFWVLLYHRSGFLSLESLFIHGSGGYFCSDGTIVLHLKTSSWFLSIFASASI